MLFVFIIVALRRLVFGEENNFIPVSGVMLCAAIFSLLLDCFAHWVRVVAHVFERMCARVCVCCESRACTAVSHWHVSKVAAAAAAGKIRQTYRLEPHIRCLCVDILLALLSLGHIHTAHTFLYMSSVWKQHSIKKSKRIATHSFVRGSHRYE